MQICRQRALSLFSRKAESRLYCARVASRLLVVFGLFILAAPAVHGQSTSLTLSGTLSEGQAALEAGDYEAAYQSFFKIQTTFKREPEVALDSFQLVVLPVQGYAALMTERWNEAIDTFNAFAQRFPEDRTRMSFVLFNLARAQSEIEQPNDAIETYLRFVVLGPERAESSLAMLESARLMFENSREDEAFEALANLQRRLPHGVLRNKARLTALQKALDLGRVEQARSYMLKEDWAVTEMPELAVLALAALKMGNELVESQNYNDAIKCYRLVPPYKRLLQAQEDRLEETRERFESRRRSVGLYEGGQFWTQFYTRLIGRLQGQLKGLREAEDYTFSLYLAYGQAYLLAERPREAWVLFERLARNSELSHAQQAEAHYRWILAAIEVGVWEDAFKIAQGFSARFPESPLVPDALYLLGNAYQKAGQYGDAIGVFDHFLALYSEHSLAPRVLFTRGYNQNLMNQPVEARDDFELFISKYPKNGLFLDARFWRALTFLAELDYVQALGALAKLTPEVESGHLEPEVAYRLAATQYAKGDYEAALKAIKHYLDDYPMHARVDEGRVLLGDIQMGRGELEAARTIFEAIAPSAGHLFSYSIFQAGKIYRAVAGASDDSDSRLLHFREHLEHFEAYLRREDVPNKDRISDALYWVGWTYIELGDKERARTIFDRALDLYGDDLEAGEVINIIDALARIEKRLNNLGRRDREAELKAWIEGQKAIALKTDRLTYYARLNLYLQSMVPPDEPSSLAFDTVEQVPPERLDAQCLGVIAATLVHRYARVAEDYLERLEEDYADSPYRSYAYYARAYLLVDKQDYEAARILLARFHAESPMHPLSIQANLLYAETLSKTARYDAATDLLEDLLKRRDARGRSHAEALLALSENEDLAGKTKRAVPYAQRVFNVYRAYPELAARAYLMSARQLEKLGELRAAHRSLEEMLSDDRIRQLPITDEAINLRLQLKQLLAEEVGVATAINNLTVTGGVEEPQK